jgi:HSP20 family molecular chaperone IbpA
MDRQFERMERQFDNMFRDVGLLRPFTGSRLLQPSVESELSPVEAGRPSKYTLNIDVGQHFDPENVKVSLKDRVLSIEAKGEYKSEDGHVRVYQEVQRQFTLPEGVDTKELKSILTPEGILRIEAPLPEPPKLEPKEIPIMKEEVKEKIGAE